jgi:uncharacterized membrane protein YeaQ/YmgE (transglycosylase-associated protein family)
MAEAARDGRGLRATSIDLQLERGDLMDLIVSLVIGGIVGWLASIVMKTNAQMGIIANIIVGIVGSMLGFWLAGVLGLASGGAVARWLVSIAGAAILIFILKALGIFK